MRYASRSGSIPCLRASASRAIIGVAALALAALAGCGDDGSEGTGSATQGAGAGPSGAGAGPSGSGAEASSGSGGSGGFANPVGESVTLELEPFDVQPGTERQVCKIINLPVDVPIDVVRFHSSMLGTSHHFNAYKALGAGKLEPATAAESAVHDCSPASEQLGGEAAYIFGSALPERTVETPPGVAFHLEPGQRLILEQHVINATPDVIQGGVTFELLGAAPDLEIEHHADIIWFANWGFLLSPNEETSATTHCTVPYDVEIFGLSSHTHKLGTHFSIERWAGSTGEHLYDSTDWSHPPYLEPEPRIALAAGEGLEWTCTWQNTTSQMVIPGKESTNEMCITFASAYPKGSLSGDPIQCNEYPF
jgi:hypothetical protein